MENQFKTKEACIEELLRVYDTAEVDVITRDFFRNNSTCSEKDWTKHFGSFNEFKRQAGVNTTRHEQKLLNQIAKHASVDNLRHWNIEKAGYEDVYLNPLKGRFQTVLVCSDLHDILCDPFYLRLFLESVERIQPERIVLNGDILDLTEFGKYTIDPRDYKPVERIQWLHKFLGKLRENAPNAQIDYVEGNHEHRLIRHLSESSPQLVSLLSDLHNFSIPDLFGIKQFEINFIARSDLTAFTTRDINNELCKNYVIVNDQMVCHHFLHGQKMGFPGISGHNHKHLVFNRYSPTFGSYEWHQMGCGHMRHASYTEGEKWSLGFMICHLDTSTKRTQFEYVDCTNQHAVIGGKWYYRTEAEMEYWT